MNSKNLRKGSKIVCEGQTAVVVLIRRGSVDVRWLDTHTYSRLTDDVLGDCR